MVHIFMSNDIKKAMQLITDGDIDSARIIFLKIIDNDSNNAMALAGIATCYEVELGELLLIVGASFIDFWGKYLIGASFINFWGEHFIGAFYQFLGRLL